MNTKRKGLLAVVIAVTAGLICLVAFLLLRGPSSPTVEKPTRISPDSEAKHAEKSLPLPGSRTAERAEQARTSFGVLVWPGMTGQAMNYSKQILSWMKEWGFDCGFVTVQGNGEIKGKASALPADIKDGAWNLSEASSKLNAVVVADGDLSASQAVALKEYLISGGWVIMPSPEDGGASAEVEDLLRLNQSRTATLTVLDSPSSMILSLELGGGQMRSLVNHPSVPTLATGRWFAWQGPSGKVQYTNDDRALPLLSFLCPEVSAVRLVPFGDGGVLHWNFPLHLDALTEDTDVKALLGKALAWLSDRPNWRNPVGKQGAVSGIVRVKDGPGIPGAKVVARVYSEWGEEVQSLEASSLEKGTFSLPALDAAIYWLKAEAEGYCQTDRYLLCRAEDGGSSTLEVLMEPEGSIVGHAYYGPGEGRPAVGITVTLAPNCRISSAIANECQTDQDGSFLFEELPAGQTFYLVAEAGGWLGMQEAPLPFEGGALEVDIHLDTPFGMEGVTRNAETQAPLRGVKVQAAPVPAEGSRYLFAQALAQETTSGEEGKFTLKLPPGAWDLTVEAEGFASVPLVGKAKLDHLLVHESGDSRPSNPVLDLVPCAALHGTVFQSSGEPAPGARLTDLQGKVYWADKQGKYKTDPLMPTVRSIDEYPIYLQLDAEWADERGELRLKYRFMKEGEPEPTKLFILSYNEALQGVRPWDIRLHKEQADAGSEGVTIIGLALNEAGGRESQVNVDLVEVTDSSSQWPPPLPLKKTVSDSQGEFKFSGVREGLYVTRARRKTVNAEGKTSMVWGEAWATVVENTEVPELEIKLEKVHIHGRLVETDGAPLRNGSASIHAGYCTGAWGSSEHLILGERGEFTVLPDHTAILTLDRSTPGFNEWEERFRARRAEGREHLPEELRKLPWESATCPAKGHARVFVILGQRAYDTAPFTTVVDQVRLGEEHLTVTVQSRGTIRGRVIDSDTREVLPNVKVKAYYKEGYGAAECYADNQGAFSLSDLTAGWWTLHVEAGGYWIRRMEVEVVENAEVNVEIDLWASWVIRGRLLLKDTGQPLITEIRTRDGVYVTGRDGRFMIPVQAPENKFYWEYLLEVSGTGLRVSNTIVNYDPRVGDIDLGDIFLERERWDNEGAGQETSGAR